MPITTTASTRTLSSTAGMLRFLARLSGRRRHVRRFRSCLDSSGPGAIAAAGQPLAAPASAAAAAAAVAAVMNPDERWHEHEHEHEHEHHQQQQQQQQQTSTELDDDRPYCCRCRCRCCSCSFLGLDQEDDEKSSSAVRGPLPRRRTGSSHSSDATTTANANSSSSSSSNNKNLNHNKANNDNDNNKVHSSNVNNSKGTRTRAPTTRTATTTATTTAITRTRTATARRHASSPQSEDRDVLRRRPPERSRTFISLVQPYLATLLILSYGLVGMADACSSRSTPKPRPPTPTPRPNITFHMYTCPRDYAEWYCLNGATCFTVKIVDSLLYNCLCANGYIGQRCEFKDLDGSYLPSRQRVMLETASIAGAVTIAVFLAVITFISVYIHCKRKQKELRTSSGVDAVDGPGRDPELRPFCSRSRSLMIFMAKNPNSSTTAPSIEQTRMPNWNYSAESSTRMTCINETKHTSQ